MCVCVCQNAEKRSFSNYPNISALSFEWPHATHFRNCSWLGGDKNCALCHTGLLFLQVPTLEPPGHFWQNVLRLLLPEGV